MKSLFIRRNAHFQNSLRSVFMAMVLMVGSVLSSGMAHSQEVDASMGSKPAKAVVDFRTGNPKLALIYLTLIGDTFRDRNLQATTKHPDFVVNFGGESVKLMAKDPKGYSPEDQKTIHQIKEKVSSLAKEGVKFEYCIYGGKLFGVEPADVPGVSVVSNGWVSLIGYQGSGYALMAAY